MTAFAADDVVLVAWSHLKSMELALDDSTGADGIAIPDDVAAERCRARTPVRDNDEIEVVLVRELPVHLSDEGGVVVEVQVLGQIHWIGIALGTDGAGRVGVKPNGVEPNLVLIKFLGLRGAHGGRSEKECEYERQRREPQEG